MSNALAIAAVTATMRNLLLKGISADNDLEDATVTTLPLDRARTNGNNANQLNLFLYHTTPSAAWRNMDITPRSKPGEISVPPLGLNLYYLITAFGRDSDTQRPFSHHLMGQALSILHDHPLLGAEEIKASLPNNDLHLQVERVRLTLQPLSIEEISKLWTGFQTQYRLSISYEASVVLIDSTRAVKAALPVLTRGEADSGIQSQPDLVLPFPTLEKILLPGETRESFAEIRGDDFLRHRHSALLGDEITFKGHHLAADKVEVHFAGPNGGDPFTERGAPKDDATFTVKIPNKPEEWPAGFYTVTATIIRTGEQDRVTTSLPLSIAPQITSRLPMSAARTTRGNVTLKLTCAPEVLPDQRVSIFLGSQEFPASARTERTKRLVFEIKEAVPGEHIIRLRVGGADSPLVDRSTIPPKFDPRQKVTIT